MWWKPLISSDARALAREVSSFILSQLGEANQHTGKKFQVKADKVLARAGQKIAAFRATHSVNWYQRSRAANSFLWALKDGGCPEDYANELTQWFVLRL